MTETENLPPGTEIRHCPLRTCEWTHALPPMTSEEIAATAGESPLTVMTRYLMPAERAIAAHLSTHPPAEWMAEISALQGDARDAQQVTAILVHKLGNCAVISDEELANATGTLSSIPERNGYVLVVTGMGPSGGATTNVTFRPAEPCRPPEPFRMSAYAEHLAGDCAGSGCRSRLHEDDAATGSGSR